MEKCNIFFLDTMDCVFGCDIRPNTQFYYFPNDSKLCKQRLSVCGFDKKIDTKRVFICGQHFDDDCFNIKVDNTRTLKNDAIPSIFFPHLHNQTNMDTNFCVKMHDNTKISENKDFINNVSTVEESKVDLEKYKKLTKIKLKTLEMAKKSYEDSLHKIQNKNIYLNNKIKKLRHDKILLNNSQMTQIEEKQLLQKVFTKSQIKVLETGIAKTRWTDQDMAIGYMIKQLGNKNSYQYLNKNLKIPLPGVSSIHHWMYEGLKLQKKQSHNDGASSSNG
ncbi:unnamed protein product [Brassicogethes aeneus]|uniref:THAP-type domain-containing protein n=1 Tax=Brassicogethes aeneus TaxID=1431903 RepID=A0A9P0FFS5_BRAAE|nr:unnamed protein product [Brassicogethes aeneus]